jgi:Carbohydrate/starch-binding module (family 21)
MNDSPVRLNIAEFGGFAGGGFEGEFSKIRVRVQNIGFTKEVALHYNDHGTWIEVALAWISNFGDYDVFFVNEPKLVEEFALRYSIGGITFWDNDQGQNYRFAGRAAVIGRNVSLKTATARRGTEAGGGSVFDTSWIEGELYVNNLSPAKVVGVRLSVDGGASWEDVEASFAGSAAGPGASFDPSTAEWWIFKSPERNFNPASSQFRFAAFYRDLSTGTEFWDNNFGQDYKVSKADGSMAG